MIKEGCNYGTHFVFVTFDCIIPLKGAGHDGSFVCINVGAHTVDVSP